MLTRFIRRLILEAAVIVYCTTSLTWTQADVDAIRSHNAR